MSMCASLLSRERQFDARQRAVSWSYDISVLQGICSPVIIESDYIMSFVSFGFAASFARVLYLNDIKPKYRGAMRCTHCYR